MKRYCSILVASVLAVGCIGYNVLAGSKGGPNIGTPPPLLQVTTLLQAPPGAKFDEDSLRGQVVVLEFWATWCGPCVAAIKHMNEMADQFAGKPVCFISITAEKADVINPFLKKRPIKTWVGLDEDRAMNDAYGVISIPHTVLIGKDGLIAGITSPGDFTAQHIQALLDGKKINLSEPRQGIVAGIDPDEKNQSEPLYEVLVRPSKLKQPEGVGGGGRFTGRGYTVQDLLRRAFDVSDSRLVIAQPLPAGRFDCIVAQRAVAGETPSELDKRVGGLMQQALQASFGVAGRREVREIEVLLVKVKTPNAPGLVVSPTPMNASHYGPGILEGGLSMLVHGLESALKKPVFDETGLTNQFEISLKWENKSQETIDPEAFTKAVRDDLGLELVPAKRPVEVVVVEKLKSH